MRMVGLCLALIFGVSLNAMGGTSQTMWDMDALSKTPKTYPAPDCQPQGEKADLFEGDLPTPELRERAVKDCEVRSLYYEGLPYKGKPTRVFAFYGVPKVPAGTKVPAMVLVHGGGGTAFESWVRAWNVRGYAAIAMDCCGCIPEGKYSEWKRHENGGPAGWGGFNQVDDSVHDQWPYHAVADVILAHSLIRSFPEVDPDRVGITGISWGGYLTCISAGIDKRFKFAVPVYGCGFLGDNSAWLDTFSKMKDGKGEEWLKNWDPSVYLPGAAMPMMWVTGTNDFAYPMDSLQKSYRLPARPVSLAIRVRMGHGHGGLGENPAEIAAFADSFCKGAKPLARVTAQGMKDGKLWAEFSSQTPIVRAELNFTKDGGQWQQRNWETVPAAIDGSRATAAIPEGATVCYMNLTDERGLIVSTQHVELSLKAPAASNENRKPAAVQAFLDKRSSKEDSKTDIQQILLWPDGAPGALGSEPADRPRIDLYLPESAKPVGAVIVCPGGGYSGLAVGHEGADIAKWLNERGVAAFVLHYRLGKKYPHPTPLTDASRALRLVRHNAGIWNVDPGRIGIWGFSAGGHLASTAATHFDSGDQAAADPIDRQSSRPDFAILGYPVVTMKDDFTHKGSRNNLLGEDPNPGLVEDLSNEMHVTARTPPTFLVHTDEDQAVPAENSVQFYLALRKAGVPAEMHIFSQGRHGLGLAPETPGMSKWPELLEVWLISRGIAASR